MKTGIAIVGHLIGASTASMAHAIAHRPPVIAIVADPPKTEPIARLAKAVVDGLRPTVNSTGDMALYFDHSADSITNYTREPKQRGRGHFSHGWLSDS